MTRRNLEWEDVIVSNYITRSISKGKGQSTWDIGMWGGSSIDNVTYRLAIGEILIIKVDIPTIEEAKKLAQDLQNVLDSYDNKE